MSGIHGLQHIDCLFATDLAHDYAIWSHTQTVLDQILCRYSTLAFNVFRTCFKPDCMRLL